MIKFVFRAFSDSLRPLCHHFSLQKYEAFLTFQSVFDKKKGQISDY